MKVISIIQQKGGVGKTTLAVHLGHELKRLYPNHKVGIADADPQKSATKWIERGLENGVNGITVKSVASDGQGKSLKKELESLHVDIVIIDLPPAIEAVSLRAALYAHLMLVPVGASALDLEAARAAIDVCEEAIAMDKKKKFLLVPTRLQLNTAAGKEIRAVLRKWGPVATSSMGLRIAYADAATRGEGISTFAPKSMAHKEITELAKEASQLLGL